MSKENPHYEDALDIIEEDGATITRLRADLAAAVRAKEQAEAERDQRCARGHQLFVIEPYPPNDEVCAVCHANHRAEQAEAANARLREALVEAHRVLSWAREELHCHAGNDGKDRTECDFAFGHRCVNCDENVDRNMELRKAIDAALAERQPAAEGRKAQPRWVPPNWPHAAEDF